MDIVEKMEIEMKEMGPESQGNQGLYEEYNFNWFDFLITVLRN